MVTFELKKDAVLSDQEKVLLAAARRLPVSYDEDAPRLTADMEKAFRAARAAKPYRREPLTVYVSPSTMKKARRMGADFEAILGELLDKAVDEYELE